MIGIIGAMPIEVEPIMEKMIVEEERTISGREFFRGRLCSREVVAVRCGVGKVNAAMYTEALILNYHPELVVNIGVAGSLTDRLGIGDIAVARDLVQYDVDTSAVGDPVGLVSTVNRIDFPCATWAVEAILRAVDAREDLRGLAVRIASGDRFVEDPSYKRFVVETFHGEVCEMEGCPIAQVCYINGVDCAVIRGISDSTDGENGLEYGRFNRLAARNSIRALEAFLEALPW